MALQSLKKYEVEFNSLKEAATAMNEAALTEKIKTNGIKGEALLGSFLAAIDSVPDTDVDKVPIPAKEFYAQLPEEVFIDREQEAAKVAEVVETVEAEIVTADEITSDCPTYLTGYDMGEEACVTCETDYPNEFEACKDAVLKVAAVKTAKRTKGTRSKENAGLRSRYGHQPKSMAARIDDLVSQGTTHDEIVQVLIDEFGREEKQAQGKAKSHLNTLRNKIGVEITENKEGILRTKVKYAEGRNKDNIVSTV